MKYYIYTLSDPITNIVRYIGKTKQDLNERLNRHLQSYYLQYKHTFKNKWILELKSNNFIPIIELLDVGNSDNIDDLEIYWIGQFKQWGFDLTNMTEGGDGYDWTGRKHKKESKEKMKMNHPFRKSIIQYDKMGNLIEKFNSIKEASRKTGFYSGHISKCCREIKHYNSVGGYIFKFDYENFPKNNKKSSIQKIINNNPNRKEVTQYDLKGNVIGEFRSLSEAVRETGCHIFLISNCCENKKYYTVNNTTFRYKGDEFDYYPYNKNIQVNSKTIIKYNLDGTIIERFDSQRDAARDVGTNHGNIKRCCELKYKTNTHGVKTNKPIVVKGFTYRYDGDKF